MTEEVFGVIGGSGLYEMDGFEGIEEVAIETPFGTPSDSFIVGRLDGAKCVFLPRHGRGHLFTPSEVNYRANIWGLKKLGVRNVLSVSAVGSLKEAIAPGHVVCVDQFIDRTRGRASTFLRMALSATSNLAIPSKSECARCSWSPPTRSGQSYTMAAPTYVSKVPPFRREPRVNCIAVGAALSLG